MAGLDVSELLELALLLVAVGMLSGFLAGVFGIGGGAILVPVFYECFRIAGVPLEARMPLCIGTSLAIIIPTTFRSWFTHRSKMAGSGAPGLDSLIWAWTLPAITPTNTGSHHALRIAKSTAPLLWWARQERIEVGMMMASEVPMHSGIRASSGTPAIRKHS